MDKITENIIEITWIVHDYAAAGAVRCIPYEELKELISDMAHKFEEGHQNKDWVEHDYLDEIRRFTNKTVALELWQRFGDVPMDPETEEIEDEWNGFAARTFREDIWHWFEATFDISVAMDLMGQ